MTDVTGVDMAIALGKLGGIGFLPRFFPAEEQANMAAQVKRRAFLRPLQSAAVKDISKEPKNWLMPE